MKIIVIGSEGYVGTELCKSLQKISDVTKIDAGWFGILDCTTIVGDIREIAPSFDFSCYDCVIYLAAVSNDPMGHSFSEITHEINHKSALRIAELTKIQGVKSSFCF